MQHLINKADLAEYDDFSGNIEDRIITPRINDAHVYDLPNALANKTLLDGIYAANTVPTAWDVTVNYLEGAPVLLNELVYTALAGNIGIEPGTESTYWKMNPEYTLRYVILKPFLAWSALRRYYLRAGRQNTPAGLTVPTDPNGTFQPLSDKGRSEIMAEAIAKADFHRQDVLNFLQTNNLTQNGTCGRGYPAFRGRVWGV